MYCVVEGILILSLTQAILNRFVLNNNIIYLFRLYISQPHEDRNSKPRRKREYTKRKHKPSSSSTADRRIPQHGGVTIPQLPPLYADVTLPANNVYYSSAEEDIAASVRASIYLRGRGSWGGN